MKAPLTLRAAKMKLADVICFDFPGYNTATVCKVEEKTITLFRPYVLTEGFECTAGVICYVGHEYITLDKESKTTFTVVSRDERF